MQGANLARFINYDTGMLVNEGMLLNEKVDNTRRRKRSKKLRRAKIGVWYLLHKHVHPFQYSTFCC